VVIKRIQNPNITGCDKR